MPISQCFGVTGEFTQQIRKKNMLFVRTGQLSMRAAGALDYHMLACRERRAACGLDLDPAMGVVPAADAILIVSQ